MPASIEVVTASGLAAALGGRTSRGAPPGGCRIIGVDGWSGSGKTHLADQLAPALGAPCAHLDDFVPGWHGLARSVELLVEWILVPLAAGRDARWQRWDWRRGEFDGWHTLRPSETVLVEGCGAGSAAARPWLSALLWMDADADERTRRLRARADWALYEPWMDVWNEQERALRAGDDPAEAADATVRTGPDPAGPLRVEWTR